jgi:hypothetical protein
LCKAPNLPKAEYHLNRDARLQFPNLSKIELRIVLAFFKIRHGCEMDRFCPACRARSGRHLAPLSLIRLWFDLMPLHQLDTCLTGLKQQGIPVSEAIAGENGSTFDVMGFTLTAEQIVELHQNGQMDANGIKAFAKSIKQDF